MAFNIKEKDVKNAADSAKEMVADLNQKAIKTADKAVDNGLKAAENWQNLAFKALKTGTYIFGKQQELLFHTLEGVKKQTVTGASRLKNLLNIQLPAAPKSTRTLKKKEVAEVAKVTKKAVAEVEAKTKASAAKATKKVAQKVAKTADTVKKTALKAAATASKAADKRVAAKAATKKKTTPTMKDDLKKIDGIGPKMETVLNKAGLTTFTQLAKANEKAVKEILLNESPRYKMFEPKEWIKEAQNLAKK